MEFDHGKRAPTSPQHLGGAGDSWGMNEWASRGMVHKSKESNSQPRSERETGAWAAPSLLGEAGNRSRSGVARAS